MDDVTICNMALGEAKVRANITTLAPTEKSKEANQCRFYYEPARDAVLQAVRWNFARKQINLALLADITQGQVVPVPWSYMYTYPPDCIQGRYIMPMFDALPGTIPGQVSAPVYKGPPVKYIVSNEPDTSGADTKVILTNQNQAVLVYTKKVVDPNMFDAQFVEALVMTLAAKLVRPLTGQSPKDMIEAAKGLIISAGASNGNEGLPIQDSTPDWIRARGYLSDYAFPDFFLMDNSPGQLSSIN